jgi:hypothetical protein
MTLNTINLSICFIIDYILFSNSILSSDVNRFIMKNNKIHVWFWDNFILIFHWKVCITILYLCTQHERQNNKMRKSVQFLLITLHLIKEHSHNYGNKLDVHYSILFFLNRNRFSMSATSLLFFSHFHDFRYYSGLGATCSSRIYRNPLCSES